MFPTYPNVFGKLTGDTALQFLAKFPTPDTVLAVSREEILQHLNPKFQKKSWPEDISKINGRRQGLSSLQSGPAVQCTGSQGVCRPPHDPKALCDCVRAQIVTAAKLIPTYNLLLTIPGVGRITAAFILSEIEDVRLFPTAKQLVAYAGLDPSVYESGKYKSVVNKISKRGSNYLRKALFQAASMAVRKKKTGPRNPFLHDYYLNKVAEGKPKMVGLIATSNKLLRIIYGMWRKNEPFRIG